MGEVLCRNGMDFLGQKINWRVLPDRIEFGVRQIPVKLLISCRNLYLWMKILGNYVLIESGQCEGATMMLIDFR